MKRHKLEVLDGWPFLMLGVALIWLGLYFGWFQW